MVRSSANVAFELETSGRAPRRHPPSATRTPSAVKTSLRFMRATDSGTAPRFHILLPATVAGCAFPVNRRSITRSTTPPSTFGTMVRFTRAFAFLFALACTGSPGVQSPTPPRTDARCAYAVRAPAAPPFVVDVHARCEGGKIHGFRAVNRDLARFVRTGGAAARGAVFAADRSGPLFSELTYSVDLDRMAREFDEIDV